MNVQVAVLCDSATDYNNRLCLLGTFDTLEAQVFPVVKPQCSIALQIRWNSFDEGDHDIKVRFMNEDGAKTLEDIEAKVRVDLPEGALLIATNHIVNLQQLTFTKAGTYLITALVDNHFVAEMQLQVLHKK